MIPKSEVAGVALKNSTTDDSDFSDWGIHQTDFERSFVTSSYLCQSAKSVVQFLFPGWMIHNKSVAQQIGCILSPEKGLCADVSFPRSVV
jgi:hypothetical protein